MTTDECKKLISKMGWKYGISPKLISTRLLSLEDKQDMLNGELSIEALETAIKIWEKASFPNYAEGQDKALDNKPQASGCISIADLNKDEWFLKRFPSNPIQTG